MAYKGLHVAKMKALEQRLQSAEKRLLILEDDAGLIKEPPATGHIKYMADQRMKKILLHEGFSDSFLERAFPDQE